MVDVDLELTDDVMERTPELTLVNGCKIESFAFSQIGLEKINDLNPLSFVGEEGISQELDRQQQVALS